MAPKSKKLRQSRMHAAIDAMRPLGFAPKVVQAKAKSLLKEYGGEDCWPFIEADAYTLLITSILEEQEKEKAGEQSVVEENLLEATGIQTNVGAGSDVGPSEQILSPVGSVVEDTASRPVQIVKKVKEEPRQAEVVNTAPIASESPKRSSNPVAKAIQTPKTENLNGWLIEYDDNVASEPPKLTQTNRSSSIKRKHANL